MTGRQRGHCLEFELEGPPRAMQEALLGWWAANRRDLPWRRTRDPWAVLVAEIMLQSTQCPG